MGHEQQDTGGGCDAGQQAGKHTDHRTGVNDEAQYRQRHLVCQRVHGCIGFVHGEARIAKTKHFSIRSQDEEKMPAPSAHCKTARGMVRGDYWPRDRAWWHFQNQQS